MIYKMDGDIFKCSAEGLVNPVNIVGVMGKGLALQFKRKFPLNYLAYFDECRSGNMKMGKVFPYYEKGKWILNFPTKKHWRNHSKIEDIKAGLKDLKVQAVEFNIETIAIPPIGCGLGGLDRGEVEELIRDIFDDFSGEVYLLNF